MQNNTLPPSDISDPPHNADRPEEYIELYKLWKLLNDKLEHSPDMDKDAFSQWNNEVEKLLSDSEKDRFHKPLRPHIPPDYVTIQYARFFHLSKILRARQGWEKLMKDTGY